MKPILTLLTCLFFITADSQQSPEEALLKFSEKMPPEKVIISLTKHQYVAGESIFFKADVLAGYQPSATATNLYTELYDKDKVLIDKAIVPLVDGSGKGSFTLATNIAEGVYYMRAYTNYMNNFGGSYDYVKAIPVYNPTSATRLKQKSAQWELKAVAEGGTILAGRPTKIGVRLLSNSLLPQTWQASLFEQGSKEPLAKVNVYNSEIGDITFLAEEGKSYLLKAVDNEGLSKEVSLPAVKKEGASLMLSAGDSKVAYQIITERLPANGAGYKMVATLYNEIVFSGAIKTSGGTVTGFFDIKSLPSGVLRFTLFDPQNQPINERLCFIHQGIKHATPNVTIDSLSILPKGFNRLTLAADSTLMSYSVQVSTSEPSDNDGFFGQLYLSSDFRQPIHQANWYFTDLTPQKKAALDALLITENWDRFSWKEVMAGPKELRFQPETYLTYTAKVSKGKAVQPLRELTLILKQKDDSSSQFMQVAADSAGNLTISEAVFFDTVKVFYKANKNKFLEKDIKIEFERKNQFSSYTGAWPGSPFETVMRKPTDSVPTEVSAAMSENKNQALLRQKSQLLEEIIVKAQGKNPKQALDERYSSQRYKDGSAVIFDFVNENQAGAMGQSNILRWLQGRVSGFTLVNSGGSTYVQLRGNRSLLGTSFAQIYIDEVPVDVNALNGYPVNNIAMIKVIKSGNPLTGANGAILIYSKRGGEGGTSEVGALSSNDIVGYRKPAAFFLPDYSIVDLRDVNDARNVLYWTAAMANGEEIPIRFYNNDQAKRYYLIVTGFDTTGQPVYLRKLLQ